MQSDGYLGMMYKYFYPSNNGNYIIENERTCYSSDINWIKIIGEIIFFIPQIMEII